MTKKPIHLLYGLPFVLIMLLLLAKFLELFPVSNWVLCGALVLGAVTFFWEGIKERRRKSE